MIGLAIVGLGNAVIPYAKGLAELTDCARVVRAATRSSQRASDAATRYGFPVTTDIDAAIHDPAVDAVLVLTPADTHLDIAERAFAAGRHVLCEKPLEVTVARGERLVAAGRRADRALAAMLQLRFRPASQRLKALLDANALGDIQAASITVPWWRPQSYYDEPGRGVKARDGGGVLMTQAIHALDLVRWLVGISAVDAAQVRTTALHRMETEDYASALLRLGNGAPATLLATVAAYPGGPEQILIIGLLGIARMTGGNLAVSFLDGTENTVQDTATFSGGARLMAFSHEPHKAVLSDFLTAIEQGRDPAIPGEEALATQRIIDTIIEKGA